MRAGSRPLIIPALPSVEVVTGSEVPERIRT